MCVDLSRLNKYVRRGRYQSPTPAEAIADITADDAKYFTIIDAAKGYHQCPLDEESQLYTTFITPFSRFKYLRAYGLSSIAEHYNRQMAEAFEGLTGFRRIIDDVSTEMPRATDFYKQQQVDILSDENQICRILSVIGRLPH